MEEGAACRIFRRWFDEVWTGKREGAMDELLARDAVVHAADEEGRDVVGPDGFRPFYRKFREAFPDIRFEIHELIGDDRIAAGRWTRT
jgi:predicted ester cyclase